MTERLQRQLSAILAADVAGYSRLIGVNEEGTLARLKELRASSLVPQVHRGLRGAHNAATPGDCRT